ncbi:ankyrin repeat domain-containing protein, partial [Verrucomicrobia bacterium]|nr:ankyrin repeat domain-containing protein [Verrucomicrobiota bacterium]
ELTTTKAPDISILYAAETKNIDAIKQHLTAGTDVNMKDSKGKTPLHHAAYWGHEEIVELLIAKGADVNAVIESGGLKGKTPLGLAWRHHPEVTDFLRKHGGKTGAWLNAYNSIHAAGRAGHIKAVKQHLASGADVNAKTMSGFTPLDATSVFNKTETADLLRKHGGKTKVELEAEGK